MKKSAASATEKHASGHSTSEHVPAAPAGVVWLGGAERESEWVLNKLRSRFPTVVLDNDSIREVFSSQLNPSHVLIPSMNRMDDLGGIREWVSAKWPKAASAFLLGEWWQGSYRTQPLPESWDRFYWYQWWDSVIPWLDRDFDSRFETTGWSERYRRAVRSKVLSDRSNSSRLISVTLHSRDMRDVWSSILVPMGWIPVFRSIGSDLPDGEFHAAILDLAGADGLGTLVQNDWLPKELGQWSQVLPEGPVVVRTSFPSWADWKNLEMLGADIIVGGMVGWEGTIRKCLEYRRLCA